MSNMAGSKIRKNIHGHFVTAEPAEFTELNRLSTSLLGRIFSEAQEHGQANLSLGEANVLLIRHPDHTFSIEPAALRHNVI